GNGDGLVGPLAAPGGDHFGRHLDMALHAEVGAEGEHLVGTMPVGEQPSSAGWDAEGLAVPLEDGAGLAGVVTQPVAGDGVVLTASLAPADFLDRVSGDFAAQGFAHQLPA